MDLVGTEVWRYFRGSGSRPKLEVKDLVADFGSEQEMEVGPEPEPESEPVLGRGLELEHAFAFPVACASASPSEQPKELVNRSVLPSELGEMFGRGAGPDEVMATVTATAMANATAPFQCRGR